jgi:hypothetical protein
MIRPLRRTHRAAVLALALVLPFAYAAALLARPGAPAMAVAPFKPAATASVGTDAFGRLVLEVDARGAPVVPDALVYWAPEPGGDGAVLLGALPDDGVARFNLPYAARTRVGYAWLYSLARQERATEFPLAQLARAGSAP